jgi:glycine/D-amino acid oxidase-like deaminating enzyme
VSAALAGGAAVRNRCKAGRLLAPGGRIRGIETENGPLEADAVVLAAGAATPELLQPFYALPLEAPPGMLVSSRPHPPLLNGLAMAPDMHLRQTAEGRILAGDDFGGSDPGADAEASARALFGRLRTLLKGGEGLRLEGYSIGYRPTPADGFPVVGAVPGVEGLYLAVMHSGVTLAPAAGLFLAEEILAGRREPLLAPYRPERFSQGG